MIFPYKPREGQEELMNFIKENDGNILIEAPTGFGKTPTVLASLLEKEYRILWAVRTGNETDRPIEELKNMEDFYGISLRGKKDMCLLARNIGEMSYDEVQYLCSKRRKECPYYENLNYVDLDYFLKSPLLYSEILKKAEKYKICPYFLQFMLIDFSDVISLSYNYILHPSLIWVIRKRFDFSSTALVIDEAHNLQYAAMNLNHDEITSGSIERGMNEISEFEGKNAREVWEFLHALELKFSKLSRKREMRVFIDDFVNDEGIIKRMRNFGGRIRSKKLQEGKRPSSSLYHIAKFFDESLNMPEDVYFILRREKKRIILERWDPRASEIFSKIWKMFPIVIFMSGTLRPYKAFKNIVGIRDAREFTISSFYRKDRIRVEIRENLTTKGNKLSKDMAERYRRDIIEFAKNDFNIGIFSASYRIQKSLLKTGIEEKLKEEGRKIFVEEEGMRGDKGRKILDNFKNSSPKGILFATCTGRFAEGADFPGESLVGIYIVGIPFERLTLKTRLFLDYYRKIYGREGRYYGYTIPAIRRASQSIGRALRSRDDRGYFILGDYRYLYPRYFNLLPEFIREAVD